MKATAWIVVALLLVVGCGSTQPETNTEKDAFNKETEAAIARLKGADPGLKEWFATKSYGYVVFPSVGKGGLVVGGAHGRGQVYEQGSHIGYAEMSQGTIGLQAGGLGPVSPGCFQGIHQEVFFIGGYGFLERNSCDGSRGFGCLQGRWQVMTVDGRAVTDQNRSLDNVLQFSNITWPMIAVQHVDGRS